MNETLLIYCYLTAVKLSELILILALLWWVACILFKCFYFFEGKPDLDIDLEGDSLNSSSELKLRRALAVFKARVAIIGIAVSLLVPSLSEMKTILGGTVLVSVSKIDGADKLPENLVAVANALLEEMKEKTNE